jgi:very-short-patch-repair endonuclease
LRANCTNAEAALWSRLRDRQLEGIKFKRQQPLEGYIVDLVSFEKRIVIEVDGGQHNQDDGRDAMRDAELAANGFRVLRFWNNEVLTNLDVVLETIRIACLE